MTGLDIVICIFLIIAAFKGYSNGFLKELASLAAIIAGAYGAFYFSEYLQGFIARIYNFSEEFLIVVSFAVTFLIIVIVINIIANILTKIADFAMLGFLNKLLGALFGVIKRILVIGVILMLLNIYGDRIALISEKNKEESVLYHPITAISIFLFPPIIEEINKNYEKLMEQKNEESEINSSEEL